MPHGKRKNNKKSTHKAALLALVEIYVNLSSCELIQTDLLCAEQSKIRLTQKIIDMIERFYGDADKAIRVHLLSRFEVGGKALNELFFQKVLLPSLSLGDDGQIQQGERKNEVLGARLIFQCLYMWLKCNVDSLLKGSYCSYDQNNVPVDFKFFYSILQIMSFHKRCDSHGKINLGLLGVSSRLSHDYAQFGKVIREKDEVILDREIDMIDVKLELIQAIMTPFLAYRQGVYTLPYCETSGNNAVFVLQCADKTGRGKVAVYLDLTRHTKEIVKKKIAELDKHKYSLESKLNNPSESQLSLLIDFEMLLKAALNMQEIFESSGDDIQQLLLMQQELAKSIGGIINKFLEPMDECIARVRAIATQLSVNVDSLALVAEDVVNCTIVDEFFTKLTYHFTPSAQLKIGHSTSNRNRPGNLAECWDTLSCYHVAYPSLAGAFSACLPRLRYFRELLTCFDNLGSEYLGGRAETEKAALEGYLDAHIEKGSLQGYTALLLVRNKLIELIERNQKDLCRAADRERKASINPGKKKKKNKRSSKAKGGSPDDSAPKKGAIDGHLSGGLLDIWETKKTTVELYSYSEKELRLQNLIHSALLCVVIPSAEDHYYEGHDDQDWYDLPWFKDTVSLIFNLYVLTEVSCKSKKANAKFDLHRLFVCVSRACGASQHEQMMLTGWSVGESSRSVVDPDAQQLYQNFFRAVDHCWHQEEERSHSLLNESPSKWFGSLHIHT